MWHPIKHLRTITHHHNLVMLHCFRCGLYKQGILHDLSKLSPLEFWAGAKYYQGNQSPNNAQRASIGYSSAWLHHKGRNRHHFEYWIDYSTGKGNPLSGMRMPNKYIAEMVCDRVAASKTYKGNAYKQSDPWEYYEHSKHHYLMHPEVQELLEKCLITLRDCGEDKMFEFIKSEMLR